MVIRTHAGAEVKVGQEHAQIERIVASHTGLSEGRLIYETQKWAALGGFYRS